MKYLKKYLINLLSIPLLLISFAISAILLFITYIISLANQKAGDKMAFKVNLLTHKLLKLYES